MSYSGRLAAFYHDRLIFRPEHYIDLNLLHYSRAVIHTGHLFSQPTTDTEVLVILFDHYVIMTTPKTYLVVEKPVNLDLLTLRPSDILQPPQNHRLSPHTIRVCGESDAEDSEVVFFPISFDFPAGDSGSFTLYTQSAQEHQRWIRKFQDALSLRPIARVENEIIKLSTLDFRTFSFLTKGDGLSLTRVFNKDTYTGRVTCATCFTVGRTSFVAIGCSKGVWLGSGPDPTSFRQNLSLQKVTQISMLENLSVLVVLADQTLFAYYMVDLKPFEAQPHWVLRKLTSITRVKSFDVSNEGERTLVVYMKSHWLFGVVGILEPTADMVEECMKTVQFFNRPKWYKKHKRFLVSWKALDAVLLGWRTGILSTGVFPKKGKMEVMYQSGSRRVNIPHLDPSSTDIVKRFKSRRPLAIFNTTEDEFIICYDKFGLYIDKNGVPINGTSQIVEWVGTAQRIAFRRPHLFIFASSFIETRNINTGNLLQIIPATDVRCITHHQGPEIGRENPSRIYATLEVEVSGTVATRDTGRRSSPGRIVTQEIVELVPVELSPPPQIPTSTITKPTNT